jgi:3-hydroxyacyl-[acyl-carrier-protein] dehydratase
MNNKIFADRATPCVNIDGWQYIKNGAQWHFEIDHNSPALDGHYPGFPILPGVFTFELCCQGIEYYFKKKNKTAKIDCVNSMRFLGVFIPGSVVLIKATIKEDNESKEAKVKFQIYHGDKKAAVAKMIFKVEN